MPQRLSRLRCGVIYTESFRSWLEGLHERQAGTYPHHVLTLDYIRCASGPQRGRAWWRVFWMPEDAAARHCIFAIGGLRVHIPKPVQLGLRDRCLDSKNGRVVVRP